MDFTKFDLTPSSKSVIEDARKIAEDFDHLKVIDLHLFYAILCKENANINFSLGSLEINQAALSQAFWEILSCYKEPRRKKKIYAPEIFDILDGAKSIAKKQGHQYIGIDHIFLYCLKFREDINDFLTTLEINVENLIKTVSICILKGFEHAVPQPTKSNQVKESNPIESCCENLNEKIANRGTFEIFGRDKETDRAFEVLLRKNKSNVIFVGEAGVGKTAIVEGMAEKIVKRECPDMLLHKEILTLDITSLISGTIFRGQMEEKIKNILDFVSENDQYILFIDEIHTIVGSGNSEGTLDLANILKPALSRGKISCIGATTEEEYKRFFKKDSALDRRFENIKVAEPSHENTKNLIMKAKKSYEDYHQVKYTEETVDLIMSLCSKHLPNKKFPDKAFDILDESGAKAKMINFVRPQEAKDLEPLLQDEKDKDSKYFEKIHKKYEKILTKWGENLEKQTFFVDNAIIYDIFAHKLDTTPENIKNGKSFRVSGQIGF